MQTHINMEEGEKDRQRELIGRERERVRRGGLEREEGEIDIKRELDRERERYLKRDTDRKREIYTLLTCPLL